MGRGERLPNRAMTAFWNLMDVVALINAIVNVNKCH